MASASNLLQDPTVEWLNNQARSLLKFGQAARHRLGFAALDAAGEPEPGSLELYITCRKTYAYVLGEQLGFKGSAELVAHGLNALDGVFRDEEHGGWFEAVDEYGIVDSTKNAYPHAFVILAASAATLAGHEKAKKILDDALRLFEARFWDDSAGRARESFNREFSSSEPYRGMNSNMHVVEAFLAAFDATGAEKWRERALQISQHMVEQARTNNWRIIEHFDADWQPLLEYNAEDKADQFRPYGSTIGHWFEWARLLENLAGAIGAAAPAWLHEAAVGLFAAGVEQGWSVDGSPGFVYTVDWDGNPVVDLRMHWVVAEAIGAAATLFHVTGDEQYADWHRTWWHYAQCHLIDPVGGSWWHELTPENEVSTTVWPGKPDIYHALQATQFAQVPVAPGLAKSLISRRQMPRNRQ